MNHYFGIARLWTLCAVVGLTLGIASLGNSQEPSQAELSANAEKAFDALRSGDASQIDELARFLGDYRLNTQVRTTLEAMPDCLGAPALREGVNAADPSCAAGCIISLGSIGDTEAVSLITDVAKDSNRPEIVRKAAFRSLGRLATQEAIDCLLSVLKDVDPKLGAAVADGLFLAGTQRRDGNLFQAVREANVDSATTRIALKNEILFSDFSKVKDLLAGLLTSDSKEDFLVASAVLRATENEEILNFAVELLPKVSSENCGRLITLVASVGNKGTTPALIKLLNDPNSQALQKTLIEALGELKDESAFPYLLKALLSDDAELSDVAVEAICKLDSVSTESGASLANVLKEDRSAKNKIAVLETIDRKGLVELLGEVKELVFSEQNVEVVSKAVEVYSKLVEPTASAIKSFVADWDDAKVKVSQEVVDAGLQNLCRRSTEKDETIKALAEIYSNDHASLARFVGVIGGKASADFLGDLAFRSMVDNSDDVVAVLDEATKALGQWTTADASDSLAKFATLIPNGRLEKFKVRAIRGYLRIVRQMGELPLEKLQKISTAKRLTEGRPQERELLGQIDGRFASKFPEKSLFNGKDLTGWEEYEPGVFRVEDGVIVGGNFETGVPRNQFLTTVNSYKDFYLRIEAKLVVGEKNANNDGNAGIQFRSVRIPNNWEMIGYQADMSSDGGYWGCLYDESRRNRMLATPDPVLQKVLLKPNDWNTYEILCMGGNVKIFLNGVKTVDYVEDDPTIPLEEKIGLQIHAGGPSRAYYRNAFICDVTTDDSN